VQHTVAAAFRNDSGVAPAMIRMHFHDCFVRVSGVHAQVVRAWSTYLYIFIYCSACCTRHLHIRRYCSTCCSIQEQMRGSPD
jgi:hypothetical protein